MDMSCTAGLGAGEERKEGGREGEREGKKGKNFLLYSIGISAV